MPYISTNWRNILYFSAQITHKLITTKYHIINTRAQNKVLELQKSNNVHVSKSNPFHYGNKKFTNIQNVPNYKYTSK